MSYSVGCRFGSAPSLLWLWCRPAATGLIQPLAWELVYAAGTALKSKKIKEEESMLEWKWLKTIWGYSPFHIKKIMLIFTRTLHRATMQLCLDTEPRISIPSSLSATLISTTVAPCLPLAVRVNHLVWGLSFCPEHSSSHYFLWIDSSQVWASTLESSDHLEPFLVKSTS